MIDTTGYKILDDGTIIGKRGKPLKGYVDYKGYVVVEINGRNTLYHRVVATALIPNPENKPQVNHIDGNKQNNHPSNLEWCTSAENIKHAFDTGLRNQDGEGNGHSRLTELQVTEIRRLYDMGISQTDIAEIYGVNHSNISLIVRRKTWKHI